MNAYVYILECADGHYYTGSTMNLDQRLSQHFCGDAANFFSLPQAGMQMTRILTDRNKKLIHVIQVHPDMRIPLSHFFISLSGCKVGFDAVNIPNKPGIFPFN